MNIVSIIFADFDWKQYILFDLIKETFKNRIVACVGNKKMIKIKALMPDWRISAVGLSIFCGLSSSELLITMVGLFWASITFAIIFRHCNFPNRYLKRKWVVVVYHAALFALVGRPALAQAQPAATSCNTGGLFSGIASFVTSTFGNTTLGTGGGSLSGLICETIGFLTISLVIGFIAILGYAAYQIGVQKQPITTVLDPFFGFVIFAGGASAIIAVMIGTTA